ncbi:MAG: CapA family protein [Actinomycetota bacterium]|nr:CapA family protein [Actinomycetota bacterium]MDA3020167.1 CapA family protein [Actinomycetota bacterium]
MRGRLTALFICLALVACSQGESSVVSRPVTLPPVALRPPTNLDQGTFSTAANNPNVTTNSSPTSVPEVEITATTIAPKTTSTTTTTTTPPRPITLAFTGDILVQKGLWPTAARIAQESGSTEPFDFTPMFGDVAELLTSADLAICHLESPIAPPGSEPFSYPKYQVPAQIIPAIAEAGYDACSTASEHVFDGGGTAMNATVSALESLGIMQSGMARTPDEIKPLPTQVGDVVVAHLSYTLRYDSPPPAGEDWRSALIDVPRIIADARDARSLGAQAVIMSLHWGNEDSAVPTKQQRQWANELTASGEIDLIVGSHSHVLQPIEQINGVWVMFGLGNFLTNMPTKSSRPEEGQDGAIVTLTMTRASNNQVTVSQPVVYPTWVDKRSGYTIRNLSVDLASASAVEAGIASSRWSAELASLRRTRRILGDQYLVPGSYLK